MSEISKTKTKAKAKAKGKRAEAKGQDGQLSCLNAAAKVLAEKGEPGEERQLDLDRVLRRVGGVHRAHARQIGDGRERVAVDRHATERRRESFGRGQRDPAQR